MNKLYKNLKKFISNYLERFISSGLYLKKNRMKKNFVCQLRVFLRSEGTMKINTKDAITIVRRREEEGKINKIYNLLKNYKR